MVTPLNPIEEVRELAGDAHESNPRLSDRQVYQMASRLAYTDSSGVQQVNLLWVAIEYAARLAITLVDQDPQTGSAAPDRVRELRSQARLAGSQYVVTLQSVADAVDDPSGDGGAPVDEARLQPGTADGQLWQWSQASQLGVPITKAALLQETHDLIARLQAGEQADLAGYTTTAAFMEHVATILGQGHVTQAERDLIQTITDKVGTAALATALMAYRTAAEQRNIDTALSARIDDITGGVTQDDLNSETQARQRADTQLGGRIDAEATARQQADTEHAADQDAHYTPAQLAAALDTFIGNADWRSRLSGSALVAAIDGAVGDAAWRGAHNQTCLLYTSDAADE